jgi:hypothetical protein
MHRVTIPMDGKTFNECWCLDDVTIEDNDRVKVTFLNGTISRVSVNDLLVFSDAKRTLKVIEKFNL